ncbi:MAG TPA: M48 family metalloprotease [bacterium]|jgi:heat shock protein HtpX|nr:M48 family metalloprotease [bacterium]
MFYSLPAETVFEAKERTRRATFYLFILLSCLYIFFINLMTVSGLMMFNYWTRYRGPVYLTNLILISSGLGVLFALIQFLTARGKPLSDLLNQMGTRPVDPKDAYHALFINLLQEAQAVTGITYIQPVVLSTPGCNAFSLQDGKGNAAIGVTEGLLAKLSRNELSAVIAHEAAHLIHEDSRLVTTCCFLSGVFEGLNLVLGKLGSETVSSDNRFSSRRDGEFIIPILIFWVISGLGYLMTKLIFMAISREREYLADADGVRLCKDPLALAESLYKISNRYRGDVPNAYEALFIMNPAGSHLDETQGMFSDVFSNHPPVSERLKKLLVWAKSDISDLQAQIEKEDASRLETDSSKQSSPTSKFMIYQINQWVGPYTPPQLLALGFVNPSSWVCPAGSDGVLKASEVPEFLLAFQLKVQGLVSSNSCPRCRTPLLKMIKEGSEVEQCSFCQGYLLGPGILDRLIARDDEIVSLDQIKKAKIWRNAQQGPLKERDNFPIIKCPVCRAPMGKGIHSMLTQVVLDHCNDPACGMVWCDGGELETILTLIQDAQQTPA